VAAPDETPALKIAVAFLVTLSVILAIALYFLYSAYSVEKARLDAARAENKQLIRAQTQLQSQYDELTTQLSKRSDSHAP
jgi:hypothetical protein